MAVAQQSWHVSHLATDSPPSRKSNIWASETGCSIFMSICSAPCVGPTYTRVKFGAKMENMGQRQECGYEEMGTNSYKSQNWFGLVNMANVQKYFLNRIHSLFQDLVYISWKWQVNLNMKI